jgi:5-(carboxyamino)imidazole ribonucleotide synthase
MSYRIAILGGGQLARMSAYAAYRLGFEVGIVARPTATC